MTTTSSSSFLVAVTLLLLTLIGCSSVSNALAGVVVVPPKKVIVSGAGGQTGQALFRKLLALPEEFTPLGLVRSDESKAVLVASGIDASTIAVVDVTDAQALRDVVVATGNNKDDSSTAIAAFFICTAAKPAPTSEVNPDTGRPVFSFPNGDPEIVDWKGQKNQIDACPAGTHVVICSTMGGTDPNHPLNSLGRRSQDGTISGGNIVKWKRTSEVYLMTKTKDDGDGLRYTIVHPGGLLNEPGGERELVVGVDDDISYGNTDSRTVPRGDVAQVMLEAVRYPHIFGGRSFDLRAKPLVVVGDGDGGGQEPVTTNFETLLDSLDGKNCDYTLGETMI
jgi:nucleoside-diphosphate-sugar epimerase